MEIEEHLSTVAASPVAEVAEFLGRLAPIISCNSTDPRSRGLLMQAKIELEMAVSTLRELATYDEPATDPTIPPQPP